MAKTKQLIADEIFLIMKFTIAYYLMILYGVVMFKPLLPIVSDTLSHTFAEAHHIATVHAKYGNNHLEKEMANSGADNNKNQSTIKAEESFVTHISTNECNYYFHSNFIIKNYPDLKLRKLKSIYVINPAPPPKFG